MGADVNMEVAMKTKAMAGLATEMVGAMEKSKVTVGLEVETAAGMETGVDMDMGMDLKSTVDMSKHVGAAVGAEAGVGADVGVDMGLMTVGTFAGSDVEPVVKTQEGTNEGLVPSVYAAASEVSAPAKVQHGPVEVVEVEGYTSMGMVPSACAAVSKVLVLVNAQLGIVVSETETPVESETEVVAACSVGDVHAGMGLEMVMVPEGVSANMAMSAVLTVGLTEVKTGLCADFDVDVAGLDMNTTWGVSSNSGVGTRAHLTFGVGMGMGTELVVSAGAGTGTNILSVAGGLRVACSWG